MGCEKVTHEGITYLFCGGRQRWRKCAVCEARATRQCDMPVIRNGRKGTCDRHICAKHATSIGPDADLCPAHATQYELNGNRFTLGDAELDPRESRAEELPETLPADAREFYQVFKRGAGWLSVYNAEQKREWVADRSHAQVFTGGRVLDATLRTHGLEAYRFTRGLF